MISEVSDNENSLNKIPILKINAKHRQRNSNYSKNSFTTIKTSSLISNYHKNKCSHF